jgi:hypothetical protein
MRAAIKKRREAMWLLYVYMLLTVVTGISALTKGAIYPGIAGLIGPTLCCVATAGLKGSFMVGPRAQKVGGVAGRIVFACLGIGLVYHSGFWLGLFGVAVSGPTWCVIGLALGYVATKRKPAERIINKADADTIFSLTKSEWEAYVANIRYPGEEVRLSHHDTGTKVMAVHPTANHGRSIQALYSDETGPPVMLLVGGYATKMPPFTAARKAEIEQGAQRDLGQIYSVSAAFTTAGPLEGVELTVTRTK